MQELQRVEQTKAQAKESESQVQMRASSYELMRDENFPKKGMNTGNPNWRRWRNQMLIDNPSLGNYIP
jgi:hypothetical protein